VLFWLGATSGSNNSKHDDNDGVIGTSYILFGRNFKHQSRFPFRISLKDPSSREFVSEISQNEGAGILHDFTTRSTTILGDINGDSYLDLMVGYPLASKCSVYLGNGVDDFSTLIATTEESFAIIGDPYDGGGFLGWSSIRVGDLNSDGCDEILVSAIFANIVYVIYGKRNFDKNININELRPTDGIKMIGHPDEINFGVSLTLLHDFRKGSRADLAITAQKVSAGQNVVYILFGTAVFKSPNGEIRMEHIIINSSACFKIIAPSFSYAGFSVAGIGDINSDGYDDLAIGSLPYRRGKFSIQSTYVIYGRHIDASGINELELSEMRPEDGFIITGGGFLVTGVGDVNYDSINDMMITAYYDWKGQGCSYLITSPRNMTYSPSLQPSSQPTAMITTGSPILNISHLPPTVNTSALITPNSSALLTPTFRPSRIPSVQPISSPTMEPSRLVLAVGTARPTPGKPSLSPTFTPTGGYHRLRGFPPSELPTMTPTINTTEYTEMDCSKSGEYTGKNESNYKFSIRATSGVISVTGNDEGGATNLYVLYCPPSDPVNVIIKNFRVTTDIISVAHLSEAGYSYRSLNEIPYSLKSGPLTLFFCSGKKLQVILASHSSFDLMENNFLYFLTSNGKQNVSKDSMLAQIQIAITFAVLSLFCGIIYLTNVDSSIFNSFLPAYFHIKKQKEKDDEDNDYNSVSSNSTKSDLLRIWRDSPVAVSADSSSSEDQSESVVSKSALAIISEGDCVVCDEERSESLGSTFAEFCLNLNSYSDDDGNIDINDDDGVVSDDTNESSLFDLSDEESRVREERSSTSAIDAHASASYKKSSESLGSAFVEFCMNLNSLSDDDGNIGINDDDGVVSDDTNESSLFDLSDEKMSFRVEDTFSVLEDPEESTN
jgi:hypothetical protein